MNVCEIKIGTAAVQKNISVLGEETKSVSSVGCVVKQNAVS
jgi:hypothetical protein